MSAFWRLCFSFYQRVGLKRKGTTEKEKMAGNSPTSFLSFFLSLFSFLFFFLSSFFSFLTEITYSIFLSFSVVVSPRGNRFSALVCVDGSEMAEVFFISLSLFLSFLSLT